MKIHPGVKPAIWGAVVGAVAFAVVGFSSLGWTLGSTAEKMATQRAETAVVAVLAPICVEKFQQQTDAAAKLVAFNKAPSWDRHTLIEKGGWATFPGTEKPNSAVASACAEKLGNSTYRPPGGLRRRLVTGATGPSLRRKKQEMLSNTAVRSPSLRGLPGRDTKPHSPKQ